jgi:hypothetical protein
MAKVNFKSLIVEKGERYAVYAAGGLMLLLMVVGILNMSDSGLPDGKSPQEYVSGVDSAANKISSDINGSAQQVPLPDWAKTAYSPTAVRGNPAANLFFDPVAPPDKGRINPTVLKVREIQADFHHVKILAYDIRETESGGKEIAVLKSRAKEASSKEDRTAFTEELRKRGLRAGFKPRPQNPMNGAGFMGGPAGALGPMGAMGGPPGLGRLGAPPGGMNGNFAGNPMGGNPRPPEGMPGGMRGTGGYAPIETGERMEVKYVPLEEESLEGNRPAWTIYPQRLVVVHASFPYKEQLEEIRQALRLQSPEQVFTEPDAAPQFRGFLIQRRVLYPDGREDVPWSFLDVDANYRETIFPRKYGDEEDNPDLRYVMLPDEFELAMPLPYILTDPAKDKKKKGPEETVNTDRYGKYKPIHLPTIVATVNNQKALNKPPVQQKAPSQLKGKGNIFKRTQGNTTVATSGQPLPGDAGFVGMPKVNKKGMTTIETKEDAGQAMFKDVPDDILLRVLDNDIVPGRLYQYRIKVLMTNPNWVGEKDEKGVPEKAAKAKLVSRPSDADRMLLGASLADKEVIAQRFKLAGVELERNLDEVGTPWCEMKTTVSVPREEFLYAVDPPATKTGARPELKPGEGMLQIQRWLPAANVGSYKEPVADWVVADVLARRGHYLGGKQLVNLPLWSSEYNKYVVREAPADKAPAKGKGPVHGVSMDPTKPGPSYVVVDVRGGTLEEKLASRTLTEETAGEVLLLDESGNLVVYSAADDRGDQGRARREGAWQQWVKKTEADTPQAATTPMNKGPNYKD